jgi:hypothetical protein
MGPSALLGPQRPATGAASRRLDAFTVLALLPDRDPPGPTSPHILLGAQFFTHHSRLQLWLRYGDIVDEANTLRPLAHSDCGEILA